MDSSAVSGGRSVMVVENFVLSCFSAAYSLLVFLKPFIAVLVGISSIVFCLLFYLQYKFNIFPKEVVKDIEEYDVMNFKGLGKLILDIFMWLLGGVVLIVFLLGPDSSVRGNIAFSFLGIGYCGYAADLAYKSFHPYFNQNQT
jgi:glucan phosphoethanolaminetransferase (alkaline phosphatase superfamily)